MVRRTLVALAAAMLFAAAVSPAVASADSTLGLSSGQFQFDVGPGGKAEGTVVVSNDGTEPLRVLIYAADQKIDKDGNIEYVVPGRQDIASLDQPSAWVRLQMPDTSKSIGNVPYIELKPGERQPVRFSITVPSNVPPGDHNMLLFFEMAGGKGDPNSASSSVSGRLGSRVRLRVSGETVQRLEVQPFVVPAVVFGSKVPYSFTVQNAGNVDQRVLGTVMLENRNEESVAETQAIPGELVFAGNNKTAKGTLISRKTLFGPQTMRVEVVPVTEEGKPVDAGKDTIVKLRQVWFIPLWLVLFVVLVVAILLGRVIWVWIRRRRERHATPAPQPAAAPAAVAPAPQPAAPPTVAPIAHPAPPSSAPPAGSVSPVPPPPQTVEQRSPVDEWAEGGQ